jgi:hypothetical protein
MYISESNEELEIAVNVKKIVKQKKKLILDVHGSNCLQVLVNVPSIAHILAILYKMNLHVGTVIKTRKQLDKQRKRLCCG